MDQEERRKAIEGIIYHWEIRLKNYLKSPNKECLSFDFDTKGLATALEEAIGVDVNILANNIGEIYCIKNQPIETGIDQVLYDCVNKISTNKEVIKIEEHK